MAETDLDVVFNGDGKAAAFTHLDALAGQLEELVDDLERERELLTARMEIVDDTLGRTRKAVAALNPPEPKPKKERKKPQKKHKAGNQWTPRQEVLDAVLDAVRAAESPVGISEVAGVVPWSRNTVGNALRTLRAREQLRVAGKTKYQAPLYAPFPEKS
jgi:hypothetical protein